MHIPNSWACLDKAGRAVSASVIRSLWLKLLKICCLTNDIITLNVVIFPRRQKRTKLKSRAETFKFKQFPIKCIFKTSHLKIYNTNKHGLHLYKMGLFQIHINSPR